VFCWKANAYRSSTPANKKKGFEAILNWLLEGRAKLAKDRLQLTQTPEQKERAATLLLASDSPSAFVRSCIRKEKGGAIWGAERYEQYQKWSRKLALRLVGAKDFMKAAMEQIEIGFGMRPRHDLARENGKAGNQQRDSLIESMWLSIRRRRWVDLVQYPGAG